MKESTKMMKKAAEENVKEIAHLSEELIERLRSMQTKFRQMNVADKKKLAAVLGGIGAILASITIARRMKRNY